MTLHVVNHTHWDREWYRPHEAFRARLVELVEQVCEALDTGQARHFHLDGQTITAADVAEVRPDLADRIAGHVAAGRMSLGPWHVLADNQLVSGENLIRNLLAARRHAARYGGLSTVGYCPDAFGHPADLPRVLRGFGIDTALVWRGAPPEHARFRWRAPDGSEVLAVNQRYYEPDVLWDAESAPERIAEYLKRQQERDPDGPWLLLNGADHLAPRLGAPPPVDAGDLVESSLGDYFAQLAVDPETLPLVEGELRFPGDWLTFLLPGTLSSRIYLKQANAAAQALLERWAEPFTVLAGRGAATAGLLRHAWELLLANAPHDSICGCSVDKVHRENEVRYERVAQLGEHLLQRSLLDLGLDTRLAGPPPAAEAEIVVVNPHPHPATAGVEVALHTAPGRAVAALLDPAGAAVPVEVTPLGPAPLFCADVDIPPDTQDTWRVRLAFVARDVPPTGWARYRVLLGDESPEALAPVSRPGRTAERDGWRVSVTDDASLTLTSPEGRTLSGQGRLVDGGDAGDSYTYDPPATDRLVTPRLREAVIVESPVRTVVEIAATLDLPAGLTADRAARSPASTRAPVRITATLWLGATELDWRVEFHNPADDHRLRAHFPGDGAVQTWLADSHFSVARRPLTDPLGPLPDQSGYEADAGVAPAQSWAALPGVGVIAPGLPEIQGLRPSGDGRPELAVTLLRAVGWLSRPDLRARTAGAGPQLATPEAQCRRALRAEIGVRPGDPDLRELNRVAALRRAPLRAWQLGADAPALEPTAAHLAVEGAEVTAYKPAEDGDGAVLRVVNRTPDAAAARVTGIAGPLAECTLAEEAAGEVFSPGEPIPFGPWQTRSFRISG